MSDDVRGTEPNPHLKIKPASLPLIPFINLQHERSTSY